MNTFIKSPFKYAGGKFKSLKNILPLLPPGRNFIEPFIGSGVVSLNTNYNHYIWGDVNDDLILFFNHLKFSGQEFIDLAKQFFEETDNTKESYYIERKLFNQSGMNKLRAIRFLWLNRHCFNGLCRFNKLGEFNTSYGYYKNPIFPENELLIMAQKMRRVTAIPTDFSQPFKMTSGQDIIYCDPPYLGTYDNYFGTIFSYHDHLKLVTMAENSRSDGNTVLISNIEVPETLEMYKNADEIVKFPVFHSISMDGSTRGKVNELLAIYHQ